jgi:hypothetical protein
MPSSVVKAGRWVASIGKPRPAVCLGKYDPSTSLRSFPVRSRFALLRALASLGRCNR